MIEHKYIVTFVLTLFLFYCYDSFDSKTISLKIGNSKVGINIGRKLYLFRYLIAILPVILLLSLRYGIGTDYFNYERIFTSFLKSGSSSFNVGFRALMRFSGWIAPDYQVFLSILAILTVGLFFYWAVKNSTSSNLPMVIFVILMLFFSSWMNIIRQALAIAISIYSFKQIENRKVIRFLIILAFAVSVHTSAIILLPCYFFMRQRREIINKTKELLKTIAIIFVVLLLYYVYLRLANDYSIVFSGYFSSSEGGTTPYFLYFAILLYIPEVYYLLKVKKIDSKLMLYYLGLALEALFLILGRFIPYGFRVAMYFSIAHVVIIPFIVNSEELSGRERQVLKLYFIALLLFRFWLLYIKFGYDGISVYKMISN